MKLTLVTATIAAALFATASAIAAPWVSRHDLTAADYQTEFNTWTGSPYNYRLLSVCGYEQSGQARYAAIWAQQSGPGWITHPGMTKAQFDSLSATYAGQNYFPVFISGFGVGGQPYYNAIWEFLPGEDVVTEAGLSYSSYVAENSNRARQGYKLVFLWTFNAGSTEYFAAIWRKGVAENYTVRVRRTSNEYQQDFNDLSGQGYQLVCVSVANITGAARYSSVWKNPGNGSAWYSFNDLSKMNYQGESWNWYYQGYRPVFASVFDIGGGDRFNVIFCRNGGLSPTRLQTINSAINTYMQDNGVPGLSLAISRQGRLVYAKGFGLADQGANEWVHPNHRFRIASVSKTFTAAAALKLADCCGLNLDQAVFGSGGILGNSFGTPPYSNREKAITTRHLLHHVTGWTTDGVWQVGGSDPNDVVDWQLDNTEPASPPGTSYQYMNADYVTAGRVIERRSGRTYEQFVQDELLAPSCITDMEIGGSTLAERKSNEVVYYGGTPYGLNPERMDANGGWIARPIDLLLFLRRIDGDSSKADLLSANSIMQMQTGSATNAGYGLGLLLNGSWWGHNGCMDGTISFLVYRTDGLAFAVTCNTAPAGDGCCWNLRSVINGIINTLDAANAWPNLDLFPCDIPAGDPPVGLANPRDLYLDKSSICLFQNGNKDCSIFGGPFNTVGSALGVVCDGDSLFIRTGSYNETVFFNRYMTVRSYDGTAVIGK
ncbi:MAG TPA: serine hydrolase [Haliangiales bacterium]|nr:serine hydrolase [Haliangiales bacterium]